MGNNQGRRSKGRGNDAAARVAGSRQVVLDAIISLHGMGRIATREAILERTGLARMSIVDDHCKNLTDDGEIFRRGMGVYEPANLFPPARAIGKMVLPGGMAKIELADDGDQRPGGCWDLTPQERAALADLMLADAMNRNQTENERRRAQALEELQAEVRTLRKLVAAHAVA